MLFYSDHHSPRILYVFKEFCRRAGIRDGIFTTFSHEYDAYDGVKINYSEKILAGGLQIVPSGFLSENKIRSFTPSVADDLRWKKTIFPNEDSVIPFDVFSGIFYFLSRYEEYQQFVPDMHDRFPVTDSLAFKNRFIEFPLIEFWIENVMMEIYSLYPDFEAEKPHFRMISTFDIDNAYAYYGKSLIHNLGAGIFSIFKGNKPEILKRLRVLKRRERDPYDSYDFILSTLKENKSEALFFFLLGDKAKYDRNLSYTNVRLTELVKKIAAFFQVGIHPSYHSYQDVQMVRKEKERLESVTGNKVAHSRQHYLRMNIPLSYKVLEESGITDDYTMGFAEQTGFRASTCFPFNFYDLSEERISDLLIHPLMLMDGTLNEYLHLSIEEAKARSESIIGKVKLFGGECVVLWHNETLNDSGKWKGWRDVFFHQLNCARK
jgi:hypothetical protein